MVTLSQHLQTEVRPVVNVFSDHLQRLRIHIGQSGPDLHHVEDNLVHLEHCKGVRPSQLVSLSLALLKLQGIQHTFCDVVLTNWLLESSAVVVDWDKFVPEKVQLSSYDRSEVIVESEDRTRTEDCGVW